MKKENTLPKTQAQLAAIKTKVTTASVRVMLSHNYSNFEVSMQLENENGIDPKEISEARINCQALANEAVNEYKKAPNSNPKEELKRVENKIKEIKNSISEKVDGKEITDPKAIAEIESLPLYGDKAKQSMKPKNNQKIPNDVMGLSAGD